MERDGDDEVDVVVDVVLQPALAGAQVAKLTAAVADQLGMRGNRGIVVVKVEQGSNAQRRGFREKDVLLQINGRNLDTVETLRRALAQADGAWQIVGSRDGTPFRVFFQ